MRNRTRSRNAGRRLARPGYPDLPHAILTVTETPLVPGECRYTTAAPHGLVGSEVIDVIGTPGGAYDAEDITVGAVPSATTFDTAQTYVGDTAGGRWIPS